MIVAELPNKSVLTAPSSDAVTSTRSGGSISVTCAKAGETAHVSPTHGIVSFTIKVLFFITSPGVLRQRSTRFTAARGFPQRHAKASAFRAHVTREGQRHLRLKAALSLGGYSVH